VLWILAGEIAQAVDRDFEIDRINSALPVFYGVFQLALPVK
jgi:hypothetical protein